MSARLSPRMHAALVYMLFWNGRGHCYRDELRTYRALERRGLVKLLREPEYYRRCYWTWRLRAAGMRAAMEGRKTT